MRVDRLAARGSRLPHFVVVHAVEGFEPGLYRYPSLDAPVRRGDLRDELAGPPVRSCRATPRSSSSPPATSISSTIAAIARPTSTRASSPAA
jgi:hypothetical protein